jgi:glucosamine-6-phosphate deaminase
LNAGPHGGQAGIRPLTLPIEVHPSGVAACAALAREVAQLLRSRPDAVLGLATGGTPVPLYEELVRLHREEALTFARARSLNLDEYLDLAPGDARSFRAWMQERFFGRVDFAPANVHFPDAQTQALRVDLQLLGLGRNGHIGFNEPGSLRESHTRVVELAAETRADAAATFGGLTRVPKRAITLGIEEILAARSIRVLAFGGAKAQIVQRTLEGPVGPDCPASFLRGHPDARFLLDAAAASRLRR